MKAKEFSRHSVIGCATAKKILYGLVVGCPGIEPGTY